MSPKESFKLNKSELSKAWKTGLETKGEVSGGFEPEDGRYMAAVTMAERGESKASGRDQVVTEYMFLDGDYKGKTVRAYDGLDRAESIPYLMRRIEALGFEVPEDLDDLETVLAKISKKRPQVRIILKTKGDFQNIYIDKLLDEEERIDAGIEDEQEEKPPKKVEKEKGGEEDKGGDSEASLEVGMRVRCLDDEGEEVGKGEVKEIDEDNMEVIVVLDNGKKRVFAVDKLRLLKKEEKKGGLKLKS